MSSSAPSIGVVGTGPAGLMAADVLAEAGVDVTLFDKRSSPGRKLLVAGSSGLNVTNAVPLDEFVAQYTGPAEHWNSVIGGFTPKNWLRHIENKLGTPTFLGTSGRYFVEDMKAASLLRAWTDRLHELAVHFEYGLECIGVESKGGRVTLTMRSAAGDEPHDFDAVCFALGGGSWEPKEDPLRWPALFRERGVEFEAFRPANAGYRVAWSEAFLKEAEGQPLKGVVLTTPKGSRKADAMVTRYGIEGTPVYFVGVTGPATLDLQPDLSDAKLLERLRAVKENLSPIRRVKKQLHLCPAALALIFHHTPKEVLEDRGLERLVARIKAFPLELLGPQPLAEAISSGGGIRFSELDPALMLHKLPGVFAAGEMLDWEAPTGGFLIQGCVSEGVAAARGILKRIGRADDSPSAGPA
ncbi:MAG: TIGR03862 family flavoprotein [Bdellovibrionales bacterium]|nr:TIGR03862 family flavoprotein [Bdellovibrionales bacterium]